MADLPQEVAAEDLVAVAVVAVVDVVVASEVSSGMVFFFSYSIINRMILILLGGFNSGPPERLNVVAVVSHVCEGQIIGMVEGNCVPLLARMIWTEKKQLIGKVDDVFGPKHAPGIAVNADT